jgi:hypothetical protein
MTRKAVWGRANVRTPQGHHTNRLGRRTTLIATPPQRPYLLSTTEDTCRTKRRHAPACSQRW